jgi:serine/threonine protein kinase/Tol biopolymer transport system component
VADRYGPYEIVASLSAGGMGEVYRARDTRLHRDVALKILPASIAADPDRRRRFLQEARAAGALNHPGIVAIYDVDLERDVPFLVTELIDGRTLRHELDRGAMPVKRVLDYGAQLADALGAAHAAAIVHRDLKPENIMVTREGRTKILDLGLAKTTTMTGRSGGNVSGQTQNQTETSLVFGTPPYMSPEQARGGAVDYRSDQFSLGTVLYEMLAGVHPFRRGTAVQTLSAIIEDEPDSLNKAKGRVPPPLIWIVERCLSKDPVERYVSTADLARDLATLRQRASESADVLIRPPRSRLSSALRLAAGLALVVVATVGWWAAMRPVRNPIADHVITPVAVDYAYQGAPVWSPDGKSIAYVAQIDGILQIVTRRIGSTQPVPITRRLFDCYDPFWAPDNRRVYFLSQAQDRPALWVVSAVGDEPELVQPNAARATISPDGSTLVFFKEEGDPDQLTLWTSSSVPGAESRKVDVGFDQRGVADALVRFAPDGSKLLVWAYGYLPPPYQPDHDFFWIVSWPDGVSRRVLSLGRRKRDAAVAFDWFPDSRHVVLSLGDSRSFGRHLWLADTTRDRGEILTMSAGNEGSPAVSPEGSRLTFTAEDVDFDLISIPNDGGPPQGLLTTSRNEFDPAWSPGQSNFAFVTDRNGSLQLLVRNRDGFEREIVSDALFPGDRTWTLGTLAFSRDGSRIAYSRVGESTGTRIWISSALAAGPPVQLAPAPLGTMRQDAPTWSPEDAWIGYVRGQDSSTWQLLKTRVGAGGETVILNENVLPYGRADWSPDGRSIMFDSRDGLAVTDPDGRNTKVVSTDQWIAHEWAADSRSIYGLREADAKRGHFMLVALDIKTSRERVVNPDLGSIPPANFPIRGLTQADTRAWVTSVARARSVINMLEGFSLPQRNMARFRALFMRP